MAKKKKSKSSLIKNKKKKSTKPSSKHTVNAKPTTLSSSQSSSLDNPNISAPLHSSSESLSLISSKRVKAVKYVTPTTSVSTDNVKHSVGEFLRSLKQPPVYNQGGFSKDTHTQPKHFHCALCDQLFISQVQFSEHLASLEHRSKSNSKKISQIISKNSRIDPPQPPKSTPFLSSDFDSRIGELNPKSVMKLGNISTKQLGITFGNLDIDFSQT